MAARKLMEAKAPLARVVATLAGGCGPDYDFDRYSRWVLKGDRFQFKRPGSRHLAPMGAALRAFDEIVKTEVERRAEAAKIDPARAAARLRYEIAAKLAEPLRAAQVLARISP